MIGVRRLGADLAASVGLFSRLPLGGGSPPASLAGAVWAFPLAGGLIGAATGAVYATLSRFGLTPLLAAGWSVAAGLLLTGALHEDGLADTADGFGGGRTRARKLEIMRDSRIGSYGALALLVSSLIRIAAMAQLSSPGRVLAGLVVAGALGRAGIVLLLVLLPPARPDGLAASLHSIPRLPALLAWGAALALGAALLPGWSRLAAPLAAALATLLLAWVSRRQIGGHTGDVLGAGAVLCECAVLTAMLSVPPALS